MTSLVHHELSRKQRLFCCHEGLLPRHRPFLLLFGAFVVLAQMLAVGTVSAQQLVDPDRNYFDDSLVKPVKLEQVQAGPRVVTISNDDNPPSAPKVAEGFKHALIFQDGRQLRGQFLALTKDEVIWQRPDASGPLQFPRKDFRWIQLSEAPTLRADRIRAAEETDGRPPTPPPVRATVKLAGVDWLFGDLTSTDGRNFTIRLSPKTEVHLTREQISWIYFGTEPAPAHGFDGRLADTGGWICSGDPAQLRVAKGVLVLDGQSIGREISAPARFEVSFQIRPSFEAGTCVLFQPTVTPDIGQGTIEIRCTRNEVWRETHNDNQAPGPVTRLQVPIPREPTDRSEPVSYRIFYDGLEQKMILLRNGTKLAEWNLDKERSFGWALASRGRRKPPVSAVFFSRTGEIGLRLESVRIQPWDGVVPSGASGEKGTDKLSSETEPETDGKLESIGPDGVSFSGMKQPLREGLFVEFENPPLQQAEPDTTLLFGDKGEINVADLRVADGRIHGASSLGADTGLSTDDLETVVPPATRPEPESGMDVLVFKSGEEVAGQLVSAGDGERIGWQRPGHDPVTFAPDRVAGVRMAPPEEKPHRGEWMTIELRNGDRWKGEVESLEPKTVRLRHPLFGEVSLSREEIWKIYLQPRFPALSAAQDSEAWFFRDPYENGSRPDFAVADALRWNHLDGTFYPRSVSESVSFVPIGLQPPVGHLPPRYEVSFEAMDPSGDLPGFGFNLSTEDESSAVNVIANGGEIDVSFTSAPGQRLEDQEISLVGKLPAPSSRLSVRAFVDSPAGTVDVMLDGHMAVRLGHTTTTRVPGAGARFGFGSDTSSDAIPVISNVRFAPWNGEIPVEADMPKISLENGDTAAGAPSAMHGGKLTVESEVGPLDLPMEKVQMIDFGGTPHPMQAQARVHLRDGSTVHFDRFHWDGKEFKAHSPLLGDVSLPRIALSEVIVHPPPVRFPPMLAPAKAPPIHSED